MLKKCIGIIAGIFVTLSAITLILYFYTFNDYLSTNHEEWDAFGSVLGAVAGSLAFVIAIITFLATKQDNEKSSREALFFRLINLHVQKVESISVTIFNNKYTGYEAVNKISKKANNYLMIYWGLKYIQDNIGRLNNFKSGDNIFHDLLVAVCSSKGINIEDINKFNINEFITNKLTYKDTNFVDDSFDKLKHDLHNAVNNPNIERKIEGLKFIYNLIYDEYGYILCQYFRNMYYVLKSINDSSILTTEEKKYYAKLYRAQMSKDEQTLGLFNSVGEYSGEEMVQLIHDYAMLDGIYKDDIVLFSPYKQNEIYQHVEIILEHYLRQANC